MAYLEQFLGAGSERFASTSLAQEREVLVFSPAHRTFIVRHGEPEQYASTTAPLSGRGKCESRVYPRRFSADLAQDPKKRRLICLRQSGRNRTRETAEEAYLGFQELIEELGLENTLVLPPVEDLELLTTAPFQKLL